MVLDASLLNTQHYKVRIKGKVKQSREGVAPSPTPWCSSYRKGSLRQLYLLIYILYIYIYIYIYLMLTWKEAKWGGSLCSIVVNVHCSKWVRTPIARLRSLSDLYPLERTMVLEWCLFLEHISVLRNSWVFFRNNLNHCYLIQFFCMVAKIAINFSKINGLIFIKKKNPFMENKTAQFNLNSTTDPSKSTLLLGIVSMRDGYESSLPHLL